MVDRRGFMQLVAGTASVAALGKFNGLISSSSADQILRSHPVAKYSETELRKLRISAHLDYKSPFLYRTQAVVNGLKKHGINVFIAPYDKPVESDMIFTGGWKQDKVIAYAQSKNRNILVLEGGFIQPRDKWLSLGFNGLNGYATFAPTPNDSGGRFNQYYAGYLKPWKDKIGGYALLIGQVPSDAALHGLNMNVWLQDVTEKLIASGIDVVFRPHPNVVNDSKRRRSRFFIPQGAKLSRGKLSEDLAGAAYCVIYSSTTAVESVLAGVPAVVMSKGSVAWPMTSHDLRNPIITPERMHWCHDLAWRQWSLEELANGTAWEHTRRAIIL